MAYITREFVYMTHDETGIDGWMPTDYGDNPLFLPNSGLGIAHDTLEHFKLDGTVVDELLAFGSVWYLRIETGRLTEHGSTLAMGDVFASDIYNIYRDESAYGNEAIPYVRTPPRGYEIIERGQEATMTAKIMGYIEQDMSREDVADDDFAERMADAREWCRRAFNYIRLGYRKAQRRWEGRGPHCNPHRQHYACDLFWDLAQTVDGMPKGEPGDKLKVVVNALRLSFNVTVKEYRPEY